MRLSEKRSNAKRRRALRRWLLVIKGDGETVPCTFCKRRLDMDTLTLDRIVPGMDGGRYTRDNVQPACARCNVKRGARLHRKRRLAALREEAQP